jgi:hypothetical protein
MPGIIVCGTDRLGKDSLIQGLLHHLKPHHVIHYAKPVVPNGYSDDQKVAAKTWQEQSFINGFELGTTETDFIFNRFHLGECVYAPRYRGYDGDYVFKIEYDYKYILDEMRLILLYTDNFGFMVDDGESFDFSKRGEEMRDFINAYKRSIIPSKIMINVHDGYGNYKTFDRILTEALTFLKESCYESLLPPPWTHRHQGYYGE